MSENGISTYQNETQPKSRTKLYGWLLVSAVTVILASVMIMVSFSGERARPLSDTGEDRDGAAIQLVAPLNLTFGNGIAVGGVERKTSVPDVVVSIDFLCPACNQFEKVYGKRLQEMSKAGSINLEYRPVAILDRASTTSYSSRAMSAFGCVVNGSPESALDYLNLLMENQPAERTAGLTDERLAEIAAKAGAPDVEQCIKDDLYMAWAKTTTQQAITDGLDHTPYVRINGEVWDGKADLMEALSASGAKTS